MPRFPLVASIEFWSALKVIQSAVTSSAVLIHGHIGGGGDWEHMCKTLRDCPSVYIDTSGSVTDEGMIDFALRYLGPERLLFATDLNFESGVGKILAADLTERQRRMIFFEN